MAPTRRQLLKWGGVLGGLAAAGAVGRYVLLPPAPSPVLAPVDELAARLMDALDPDARAEACVAYDDPARQRHNRGVWGAGLDIWGSSLGRAERQLVVDLFHAGLSPAGRARVPRQFFVDWPGVHLMRLLVCGDPRSGPWQIVLSAPHLNLRLGGESVEGAAFGGPQVYGDQRGDGDVGLPGNVYRHQLVAAQELVAGLPAATRAAVRRPLAPPQVRVGLQGAAGVFDGVPVGELPGAARERARALVASILGDHEPAAAAQAWACLEANGGVDALHLADYEVDHEGGRRAGDAPSQIVRLEGPAAVLYYRGEPHLHAFVNIGRDGERPLSVGELLGENPRRLEGAELAAWYETAMRAETGADVAYYPEPAAVGRLRAGPLRTGDLHTAESWGDLLHLVELTEPTPRIRERLAALDRDPAPDRPITVATTGYQAEEEPETLGRVRGTRPQGPLRDALVAHARARGFGAG